MKNTLILACIFLGFSTLGFSQSMMLDVTMPGNNTALGYGLRTNMFLDVSSKWEIGGELRLHSYAQSDGESSLAFISEGGSQEEVSLGLAARYHLIGDLSRDGSLYISPGVAVNVIGADNGIDFSGLLGYGKQLPGIFRFRVEAGLRQRSFLYNTENMSQNKVQPFVGIGLGIGLTGGKYRAQTYR